MNETYCIGLYVHKDTIERSEIDSPKGLSVGWQRGPPSIAISLAARKTYLGWVRQLAAYYPDRSQPGLTSREILDFLVHLQNERKLASSTIEQAACTLRILYCDQHECRWNIWSQVKIVRDEPLPEVLTRREVARLLDTFNKGLYHAFFTVVYQCGLRLSEALNLRPGDINGDRLVIRVRGSLGISLSDALRRGRTPMSKASAFIHTRATPNARRSRSRPRTAPQKPPSKSFDFTTH